jgi:threonine dehydratase
VTTLADVRAARERLAGALAHSPLETSERLSKMLGGRVALKLENLQRTGSFKERGALNRLLTLSPEARAGGVVAGSAGNHAQAVAYHAARLAVRCTIVMPVGTPLVKVTATREHGARVMLHGNGYDEAFAEAERCAAAEGLTLVHGFDDDLVMAGTGTIGLEVLEAAPDAATVVVPIGGGGLIGGIAVAVKETRPDVRVIGVQSARVPSMIAARAAGAPVSVPSAPTLADGIAVRRVGAHTLPIVQRYVDEIVTVEEEELAVAVLFLLERQKTVAEGAGAAALAALLHRRVPAAASGTTVAVVSGGNIDVNVLARIIERGLVKDGRLVRVRVRIGDHPGDLHRLLGVVAESRANVMDIEHNRAFTKVALDETVVDLTVETRGPEHVRELEAALARGGYEYQQI